MIISNTTPLINFSSIERLDILYNLFGEIIIPPAVKNELLEKVTIFPKLQTVLEDPNIAVLNLKDDRNGWMFNIGKAEKTYLFFTLKLIRDAFLS